MGDGELPAEIHSRRIRPVTTGGGTTPTFRPFTTNEAERYQHIRPLPTRMKPENGPIFTTYDYNLSTTQQPIICHFFQKAHFISGLIKRAELNCSALWIIKARENCYFGKAFSSSDSFSGVTVSACKSPYMTRYSLSETFHRIRTLSASFGVSSCGQQPHGRAQERDHTDNRHGQHGLYHVANAKRAKLDRLYRTCNRRAHGPTAVGSARRLTRHWVIETSTFGRPP